MSNAYKPFTEAELERGRAMFLRIFGPDYLDCRQFAF